LLASRDTLNINAEYFRTAAKSVYQYIYFRESIA